MGPSPKNMCEDPAIQRFIQSNIEEIFVTGKNFQLLRSQSAKSRTYKQRKSKVFFVFFFPLPKVKSGQKGEEHEFSNKVFVFQICGFESLVKFSKFFATFFKFTLIFQKNSIFFVSQ